MDCCRVCTEDGSREILRRAQSLAVNGQPSIWWPSSGGKGGGGGGSKGVVSGCDGLCMVVKASLVLVDF